MKVCCRSLIQWLLSAATRQKLSTGKRGVVDPRPSGASLSHHLDRFGQQTAGGKTPDRSVSVQTRSRRPERRDLPQLLAELRDKNPDIRENAAIALGAMGVEAKESVSHFIEIYDRSDIFMRMLILESLERIGSAASPSIPLLQRVALDRNRIVSERIKAHCALDAIRAAG